MPYQYPFDPTGLLASNLVPEEQHTVTDANYRDHHFVIPKFAPFFIKDFKLIHKSPTGELRELVEKIDYTFVLPYLAATRAIGMMVYGAVVLNDTVKNGTVGVVYRTLGGEWMADINFVAERIAEKAYNPRVVLWDVVTNVQELFPPIDHTHQYGDVLGQKELVEAVLELGHKIIQASQGNAYVKHLLNTDNPHETTAAQVGLGNVPNYKAATNEEALQGDTFDLLVTVGNLRALQDSLAKSSGIAFSEVDSKIKSLEDEQKRLAEELALHVENIADAHDLKTRDDTVTTLSDEFKTHCESESAHGLTQVKDDLRRLGDSLTQHVESPTSHGVDQLGKGIRTLGESLTSHADEPSSHGLDTLSNTVTQQGKQIEDHLADTNDPHETTKDQVSLGSVEDLPVATAEQVALRTPVKAYVTLDQMLELIKNLKPASGSSGGGTQAVSEYNLVASSTVVNEGDRIHFMVNTRNVADGTNLYWKIINGTAQDVDFTSTQGTITVYANAASFWIDTVSIPKTSLTETFGVWLMSGSPTGIVVASSTLLTIQNTNVASSYTLSADAAKYGQSSVITVSLIGTNVIDGTMVYWNVAHLQTNPDQFVSDKGHVQVVNNEATIELLVSSTYLNETPDLFKIQLRSGSNTGSLLAETTPMVLTETLNIADLMRMQSLNAPGAIRTARSLYVVNTLADKRKPRRISMKKIPDAQAYATKWSLYTSPVDVNPVSYYLIQGKARGRLTGFVKRRQPEVPPYSVSTESMLRWLSQEGVYDPPGVVTAAKYFVINSNV